MTKSYLLNFCEKKKKKMQNVLQYLKIKIKILQMFYSNLWVKSQDEITNQFLKYFDDMQIWIICRKLSVNWNENDKKKFKRKYYWLKKSHFKNK